jgi:hypothetical protein
MAAFFAKTTMYPSFGHSFMYIYITIANNINCHFVSIFQMKTRCPYPFQQFIPLSVSKWTPNGVPLDVKWQQLPTKRSAIGKSITQFNVDQIRHH